MSQIISNHIKSFWKISLSIVFCLLSTFSIAQKKERVYMSMNYKQVVDEYRLVEVNVRTRIDGKFSSIQNIPIQIKMDSEDGEILLATVNSDENGHAKLVIDKDYSFFKDDEGKYTLRANFEGNENYKKAGKKSKMRDFYINADLVEEDSIKTIYIDALEYVKDSLSIPSKEVDFEVYVKRMFADLKVANGVLVNGKAQITFPDNIPGDINGKLTIRIFVDERDYQVVELTKSENWGIPLVKKEIKNKNATTISYVVFMIMSVIIIAISGLFLSKRINTKS